MVHGEKIWHCECNDSLTRLNYMRSKNLSTSKHYEKICQCNLAEMVILAKPSFVHSYVSLNEKKMLRLLITLSGAFRKIFVRAAFSVNPWLPVYLWKG